eukprot:1852736-Pyramimonas_sp.AAC.1
MRPRLLDARRQPRAPRVPPRTWRAPRPPRSQPQLAAGLGNQRAPKVSDRVRLLWRRPRLAGGLAYCGGRRPSPASPCQGPSGIPGSPSNGLAARGACAEEFARASRFARRSRRRR